MSDSLWVKSLFVLVLILSRLRLKLSQPNICSITSLLSAVYFILTAALILPETFYLLLSDRFFYFGVSFLSDVSGLLYNLSLYRWVTVTALMFCSIVSDAS